VSRAAPPLGAESERRRTLGIRGAPGRGQQGPVPGGSSNASPPVTRVVGREQDEKKHLFRPRNWRVCTRQRPRSYLKRERKRENGSGNAVTLPARGSGERHGTCYIRWRDRFVTARQSAPVPTSREPRLGPEVARKRHVSVGAFSRSEGGSGTVAQVAPPGSRGVPGGQLVVVNNGTTGVRLAT
jgi:hypothetical protein